MSYSFDSNGYREMDGLSIRPIALIVMATKGESRFGVEASFSLIDLVAYFF